MNSLNSSSGKWRWRQTSACSPNARISSKCSRDVVLGHGEEVAVGHQVEKRSELFGRGADGASRLAHCGFDQGEPARGIDRLAIALLQNLERAHVEIAQQHVAPVVVDVRRDRAHVGKGHQVERLQAVDRADRARELLDRAHVVDVALLRHLRHHQMVAHEEHHQIGLLAIQSQAARDFGREQRAALVMVVAVALADIVQDQGEKNERQRGDLARDLGQQRISCP